MLKERLLFPDVHVVIFSVSGILILFLLFFFVNSSVSWCSYQEIGRICRIGRVGETDRQKRVDIETDTIVRRTGETDDRDRLQEKHKECV